MRFSFNFVQMPSNEDLAYFLHLHFASPPIQGEASEEEMLKNIPLEQ